MALWILGPVVASAAFGLTFFGTQRLGRKKREPWMRLLAEDAEVAARAGGVGVLGGIAGDGQGRLARLVAPLTGRACIAFHVEVISRERTQVVGGQETTWRRVFEDAQGQAIVMRGDHPVGRIELRNAQVLLPPDLVEAAIPGVTVHASSSSAFDRTALPPHLLSFVANAGLPAATKDSLFSAGRNLTFNERIVVPGQPIVAVGACVSDPEGSGVLVHQTEQHRVLFSNHTASEVREKARRVPVASAVYAATAAALLAGATTMGIVAATSADLIEPVTIARPAEVSREAGATSVWACDQPALGMCTTYDMTGGGTNDDPQMGLCRMGGGSVLTTCNGRPKAGCCTTKLSTGATQVRCVYADDLVSAKKWTCD